MQWILGIVLAAVLFVVLKQWGRLSAEKKKAVTWKTVFIVGGVMLAFMVLTGRVHVLTAAVAGLIPLLRKLPEIARLVPTLNRFLSGSNAGESVGDGAGEQKAQAPDSGMSEKEACEILNVTAACTREEVVTAHRRLIQKLHPDRGGSDYLAAKINEAKSVLLRSQA